MGQLHHSLAARISCAFGKADVECGIEDQHHSTQDINDNENPKRGLILNNKDITIPQRNTLEYGQRTGQRPTHTTTRSWVQLDAPVQVQRQESHNCWMMCPE